MTGGEMQERLFSEEIKRPTICDKCGGVMVYMGVGEYQCEDCGRLAYDDYGKVRNYLERHKGANVAAISDATGVTHKSIRDMIKEKRFEVVENRGRYIRCEVCGVSINSGRLCHKCEEAYHREVEERTRAQRKKRGIGYGEAAQGDQGIKRYTRER